MEICVKEISTRVRLREILLFVVCLFNLSNADWFPQNSGTSEWLTSVYFTDASTGYVVGASGPYLSPVLKTTNGGGVWIDQVCTPEELWCVCFPVSSQVGYISGNNAVHKTTNGGTSWVTVLNGYGTLTGICFPNTTLTGYVVGQVGTILKTTNSGSTWITQQTQVTYNGNFSAVHFPVDAQTGYVVGTLYDGQYNAFKTTDGGATWFNRSTGNYYDLNCVYFPTSTQTGYVVGDGGLVMKTTDGGISWTNQSSGTSFTLNCVNFPVNDQVGYAVGDYGTVIKTTNGGASWLLQNSNTTTSLSAVHFPIDNITGYVVGGNGIILKTTDGGGTWISENQTNDAAIGFITLDISPNPCTNTTQIRYALQYQPSKEMSIQIFDNYGNLVKEYSGLNITNLTSSVTWNCSDESERPLPAGIYFVQLKIDEFSMTEKLISLRSSR